MLVCNVSLRPPRRAISSEIAEAATAVDALATGNVVFATLVDDPASVGEIVDAFLGSIMLEAASADVVVDASIPVVYAAVVNEAATAADTSSWSSGDPSFASVKLLMGFNGTNGSTGSPGMTDESSAAHGTATVGGGSISTAQSVFGGSSLNTTGSGGLLFADHADWNLSNGQFTVEFRMRPSNVTLNSVLFGQWHLSSGQNGWIVWHNSSANLVWSVSTTGSDQFNDLTSSTTLSNNTWYAVCVDYDGTKYRMYIDGVMVASSTTARTIFNSTLQLAFASAENSSLYYPGFIDECRLTKGVARYASDSGYTVATSAFPRS